MSFAMTITMSSAHFPIYPSLHLRHNSFSNPSVALPTSQLILLPSVALPTSQLILQPFRCYTYVTAHSPTIPLLHLRHSSFSNRCFASATSQALHLIHLASHPCSRALTNHSIQRPHFTTKEMLMNFSL